MSDLSRDDVLKLARLARLQLSDDEVTEYQTELAAVLDYVAQLDDVDVAGLEPTSQVTGLTNVMRDDVIQDYGMSQVDLLRNVPQTQDQLIKVKRMVN